MAPTLPLSKDWRFAISHPKEFIIGDVLKRITTRSKLYDFCGHYAFISHIESKNILESEGDSFGYLQCKMSSINLSATKFGTLFLDPMIDQQLVLNGFLSTSWMSRVMLFRNKPRLVA